jgi:hypothetical protein
LKTEGNLPNSKTGSAKKPRDSSANVRKFNDDGMVDFKQLSKQNKRKTSVSPSFRKDERQELSNSGSAEER